VKLDKNSNMVLNIAGKVPILDSDIKILQSRSFKFWNKTNTGDFCWMRYAGPRYVLTNTSNNCFVDLDTNSIQDESVTGTLCEVKDKQMKPLEKAYVPHGCNKDPRIDERYEMVLRHNGDNLIYCPNGTITIKQEDYKCPDHIFALSLAESFRLKTYQYVMTSRKDVLVSSLDRQLNEDINQQLSLPVWKIKIANTSAMDQRIGEFGRLVSRLTGHKLEKYNASFPAWLSEKFSSVANFLSSLWSWFEMGIIILISVIALVVLSVTAPFIEITFKMVVWMMSKAKSLIWRVKHSKPIRKLRKRRNWDDSYVIRQDSDEEYASE